MKLPKVTDKTKLKILFGATVVSQAFWLSFAHWANEQNKELLRKNILLSDFSNLLTTKVHSDAPHILSDPSLEAFITDVAFSDIESNYDKTAKK